MVPAMPLSFAQKTIVLGIGGGIAAYKCGDLVRRLGDEGADIHVILTTNAHHFITPLTLQTLSGNPVHTDLFSLTSQSKIDHLSLAHRADIIVVAPATADILARIYAGICDDLLTTTLCATKSPVLLAPSMHHQMWENPVTERNVKGLRKLGYHVLEPEKGNLASGDVGWGRLPESETITRAIEQILS